MNRYFAFASMLTAGLLLAGCSSDDGTGESATKAVSKAEILTLAAADLPVRYVTSGTVTSDHRVSISSRLSGYIRELPVREGDSVKAGDVLVRVDPVNARQGVVQAEADMSDAKADLNRYEELFKASAVSKQQLDRIRLRYKVARSQLEQARNQLSYAEVRSPVDGVVVEKKMNKGDLASPGAPILTLEDPASLLVETYVSEQYVSGIHAGDEVEIEVASLKQAFAGTVRQVVQAADAVTHQFLIKIALELRDDVHPGMYAQVAFKVGSRKGLQVPAAAVIDRGGLNGIYVADSEGIVNYRQIRIGQVRNELVEVLAGLHEGDTVAWNGSPALVTGMKVQAK
ncbi:RND family efflux transporter, MFP subunit [Mariprofundus ferrinatatus]|uniref:RND family efflux transporter, MFP subunit n=1 Tax=Mariprofundus ferrinatatus TaxID=1921087 RepID=A0A2K8L4W2_9PROT|nr:efflux RND transporter periplasmic adaptor subunit [Mariprofundus ferrinatatus]ATX82152.1 RND family efflux transporter, MFP subunit [Mariprofundus ferrinatatus]